MNFQCENDRQLSLRWTNTSMQSWLTIKGWKSPAASALINNFSVCTENCQETFWWLWSGLNRVTLKSIWLTRLLNNYGAFRQTFRSCWFSGYEINLNSVPLKCWENWEAKFSCKQTDYLSSNKALGDQKKIFVTLLELFLQEKRWWLKEKISKPWIASKTKSTEKLFLRLKNHPQKHF